MRVQVANLLGAAAQYASPARMETLSEETRLQIVARAKETFANYESWPSLVPEDWWPIALPRKLISQQILDAGVLGQHCDIYPHTSVCESWLVWRTTRIRILSLMVDFDQAGSKDNVMLQIEQTADDILASVPFMLGSKCEPADMYDMDFVYPCLPGETVSVDHYRSAAAFGGLTLWIPLKTLLEHARHLRKDQMQFTQQQLRRIAVLYDVRLPVQDRTLP
ncbi:MAG: hypothetical protein Q9170_000828 [Blastenia crenularia]